MKVTRHFVERAEERAICAAEVREALHDVREDERKATAIADLLASGETVRVRARGIALVLAGVGADVRIVTTYRSGKR